METPSKKNRKQSGKRRMGLSGSWKYKLLGEWKVVGVVVEGGRNAWGVWLIGLEDGGIAGRGGVAESGSFVGDSLGFPLIFFWGGEGGIGRRG